MQPNTPAVTGPVDQLVRPADETHPLVRRLDDMAEGWLCAGLPDAELPAEAAREIERLSAEVAELDALRDKLTGILTRTAIALRGPEPPLTRWSWHDLPERAEAAIAAIALMRSAGGLLSNVAYNLAQKPGHALTSDDVTMLDKMRREWDAALKA